MDDKIKDNQQSHIKNLELVDWVEEEDSIRGWPRTKPLKEYKTFQEARDAILEHGPFSIFSSRVDVTFFVLDGVFDNELMAVRVSGVNIRRFLIRENSFDSLFGTFPHCIDMIRSNNAVECELELHHLKEYAKAIGVSEKIDPDKEYRRAEVDTLAALQLLSVLDKLVKDEPYARFSFDLGFSVGRLFGSIQNLATLEKRATKGDELEKSYKERGKKSGSDKRKEKRLLDFICEIERVHEENPALNTKEEILLRIAFDNVIPEGSYGHGQFDNYCTAIRSQEPYKARFDKLFR